MSTPNEPAAKRPQRGGVRPLSEEERKILADLGLPDTSPVRSRTIEAIRDALRQANLSKVTRAVWFHDRKKEPPEAIADASGIRPVQLDVTQPVISDSLRKLRTDDDELVVIGYLGGYLVPTED